MRVPMLRCLATPGGDGDEQKTPPASGRRAACRGSLAVAPVGCCPWGTRVKRGTIGSFRLILVCISVKQDTKVYDRQLVTRNKGSEARCASTIYGGAEDS